MANKMFIVVLIFSTHVALATSKKNSSIEGTRKLAETKIKRNITLKNTLCIEVTGIPETRSFEVAVEGSNKMLSLKPETEGFTNNKTILMDACKNRRPIDLTYDENLQTILSIKYADIKNP